MAELNLKQIIDKLNTEFTGEQRKLVFWYDDTGDFAEDIDNIELNQAKVYKLTKNNQFQTKFFLSDFMRTGPHFWPQIWGLLNNISLSLTNVSSFLVIRRDYSDSMI